MSFRRQSRDEDLPRLHSIFKGEIVRIQTYGAFVKIPGFSRNGLVHISQMSNTRLEKPEEVVEMGERVYCKVIAVEPDGMKISLSMKVVNQTTGSDQDPSNVQSSRDEQHRKKSFQREIPKIELGAIYDTVCRKCGGRGHLAQDCFHRPGDKTYDLLEEEFRWPAANENRQDQSRNKEKKKSKKSKKKHKKSKHSSDEESNKIKTSKKKHRKEKRGHKSRKDSARDGATSSSGSDSRDSRSPETSRRRSSHHRSSEKRRQDSRSPERKPVKTQSIRLLESKEPVQRQNSKSPPRDVPNRSGLVDSTSPVRKPYGGYKRQGSGSPERKLPYKRQGSGSPERKLPYKRQGSGSPERKLPYKRQGSGSPERKLPYKRQGSGSPERRLPSSYKRRISRSPERRSTGRYERRNSRSPDKKQFRGSPE